MLGTHTLALIPTCCIITHGGIFGLYTWPTLPLCNKAPWNHPIFYCPWNHDSCLLFRLKPALNMLILRGLREKCSWDLWACICHLSPHLWSLGHILWQLHAAHASRDGLKLKTCVNLAPATCPGCGLLVTSQGTVCHPEQPTPGRAVRQLLLPAQPPWHCPQWLFKWVPSHKVHRSRMQRSRNVLSHTVRLLTY